MADKATLSAKGRQRAGACVDCGGPKYGKYRCRQCYLTRRGPSTKTMADVTHAAITLIERAIGNRADDGDVEDLALLLEVGEAYRRTLHRCVNGLRDAGYSDRDIGEFLGVTKQAVQQRFPRGRPRT
jgi:transposase-like protein